MKNGEVMGSLSGSSPEGGPCEAGPGDFGDARYVYAVVLFGSEEDLGGIGLDCSRVYTVPRCDISALVHRCSPKPYDTSDKDLAEGWVIEHNYVIDHATERFGTVIPFSFDVIVRGDDGAVAKWLEDNYNKLKDRLVALKGKAEYGVQVFYDPEIMRDELLTKDVGLSSRWTKLDNMPRGRAYLEKRRLELELEGRIAAEAGARARRLKVKLRPIVDEMKVDRSSWVPDGYRGMKVILSLSCLLGLDREGALGKVLEEVNDVKGYAVRFTGPWAPFSFVHPEGRR